MTACAIPLERVGKRVALFLVAFLLIETQGASLELPTVLGDHMVMQREIPAPIWGLAEPGDTITVTFAGQIRETIAAPDGSWQVNLDPLPASAAPRTLSVHSRGEDRTLDCGDVLVGDVWLCSGQSNMQWPVHSARDADIEIRTAGYPEIRLYQVDRATSQVPRFSARATWRACSPDTIGTFSAVGYSFGRDLHHVLEIPVGLIDSSWGGSPAEAWTRVETLAAHEVTRPILRRWERLLADYPARLKQWEVDMAIDKRQPPALGPNEPGRAPRKPQGPDSNHRPGNLAEGMIAPVVPFGIRGAIWYQGEANAGRAYQYRTLLPMMIRDWRERWRLPPSPDSGAPWKRFPFGIVQLANFLAPDTAPTDSPWPHLRDAQRHTAETDPAAGLAVVIDLGEADDVHPRNKQDVGRRLARWALADVYHLPDIARGGPEYLDFSIEGDTVTVRFRTNAGALKVHNGWTLNAFTIAGADRTWRPARAQIVGNDTVAVSSDQVPAPVAVRYAWSNNPVDANLVNESQLPAGPFRTDDWEGPTHDRR